MYSSIWWKYEESFVPDKFTEFFSNNWSIPLISVSAYLAMCYFGPNIMKNRKAFDLQLDLAAWNALLALFSVTGAYITMPALWSRLMNESFKDTICSNARHSWAKGSVGLWVMLFCASKIPELIDTVFIVLRKKPLIFLHWYHHFTVLLFCWDAYSSVASTGLYFVAMNYFVHAVMYSYYFLKAVDLCPKNFPAYIITFLQIVQMIVGTVVTLYSSYYYFTDECFVSQRNIIAGGLMYTSYLLLFVQFALKRYIFKTKKTKQQ